MSIRMLLALAGALALGGCGGDADERLATGQVERFLAAMAAGDDARACATMAPSLRRAITTELRIESEPGTCATRAADVYSPAKAPGNPGARVARVAVAGDRATATVTATGEIESVVELSRQDGGWRIADF